VATTLRQDEARIGRLAESNIIGIFCWDTQGRLIDANEAFSRIVGYSRQALLARKIKWTDLSAPELRHADAQAMKELLQTGSLVPYEQEFVRKDGERVQVLIGAMLFPGHREGGVTFVLDLSERRRVEQALRESETRYRCLAEAANDAIITSNDSNTIVYANPSTAAVFGYEAKELLNQPLGMLFPDFPWHDDHATSPPQTSDGDGHAPVTCLETRAIHKNGHELLLEISIGRFHLSNRGYFTVIARDITERKRSDALCRGQNELLEMIAMGTPVEAVLDKLIRLIESQIPGMLGSVLLLGEDGEHVRHGAAPHLAPGCVTSVDGESIARGPAPAVARCTGASR